MLINQDEVVNVTVLPEETAAAGDMRNRFKRLSLIFGGKNKSSSKTPKDSTNNTEDNSVRPPFSLFSKKPPKPLPSPSDKPSGSVENDWTV